MAIEGFCWTVDFFKGGEVKRGIEIVAFRFLPGQWTVW